MKQSFVFLLFQQCNQFNTVGLTEAQIIILGVQNLVYLRTKYIQHVPAGFYL